MHLKSRENYEITVINFEEVSGPHSAIVLVTELV
jgi:hypothetical protein